MKILHSISKIEKVLPSAGSSPALVLCNDFNFYACKYGKPHDLFNEYIAASFGKIWEIPIPESCFVEVKEAHIPDNMAKRLFEIPCFGSFYLEHALDINMFFTSWVNRQYDLNTIINKYDYLKIALFDIWLSNEDRNHNNSNLLINPETRGNVITAIDHVAIFNSNSLETGIYQISEDESLINADYFSMFFRRGAKLIEYTNCLEENFYLYIEECKQCLPAILQHIPSKWNINIADKQSLFMNSIFSESWIKETIQIFKTFIASR